eukprot:753154-Hanusia_phi.AAC.4
MRKQLGRAQVRGSTALSGAGELCSAEGYGDSAGTMQVLSLDPVRVLEPCLARHHLQAPPRHQDLLCVRGGDSESLRRTLTRSLLANVIWQSVGHLTQSEEELDEHLPAASERLTRMSPERNRSSK